MAGSCDIVMSVEAVALLGWLVAAVPLGGLLERLPLHAANTTAAAAVRTIGRNFTVGAPVAWGA
jgi:hypothetical protein